MIERGTSENLNGPLNQIALDLPSLLQEVEESPQVSSLEKLKPMLPKPDKDKSTLRAASEFQSEAIGDSGPKLPITGFRLTPGWLQNSRIWAV